MTPRFSLSLTWERGAPIVSRDLCSLIQKFLLKKTWFSNLRRRALTRHRAVGQPRRGSFILFWEGGYQSCRMELLHNARVKTCLELEKDSKDLWNWRGISFVFWTYFRGLYFRGQALNFHRFVMRLLFCHLSKYVILVLKNDEWHLAFILCPGRHQSTHPNKEEKSAC